MMDIIAALGSVGAFIGGWVWVARWLKGKGRGFILRHLIGISGGSLASFLLVGVLLGIGVIEPAEPTSDAQAGTGRVAQDAADTEVAEALSDAEEVDVIAQAGVPADGEETEAVPDQWAEQRARIEAGPDFGITPAQYAERFNSYMMELEAPFTITADYEPSGQAADTFSATLNEHMVLTGSAKPGSGKMNGVIFIGQGDGTNESGALVVLGAAVGLASAQANADVDHLERVMNMVIELVSEASQTRAKAAREVDGLRYTLTMDDLIGAMFTVEPVGM